MISIISTHPTTPLAIPFPQGAPDPPKVSIFSQLFCGISGSESTWNFVALLP
jgi:hypothetical protein